MMKRLFLIAFLAVGVSTAASAQVKFGIKGGMNINTSDFSFYNKEENNAFVNSLRNRAGYHAGAYVRFQLPVVGLYIQPEVLYAHNGYRYSVYDNGNNSSTELKIKENLIQIPVLAGIKLAFIRAYLGPKFSFNLGDNISKPISNDSRIETDFKDKVFGYQVGLGLDLFKKVSLDINYNGNFKRSRQVINVNGQPIGGASTNKQIWLSLGYIF